MGFKRLRFKLFHRADEGAIAPSPYVGRLALSLAFLREGGGAVKVSFQLAILDAAASYSVVSEELGGAIAPSPYVGRLALALAFLREGGGAVKVSFQLAILDAAPSYSVVSEELGGTIAPSSYVGRLALAFLREGGGVVKVSFELTLLGASASSSVVSEELGSEGCEKMLGSGTMTEESAVVDVRGVRTGWYKECRPDDELVSGTRTLYRERGSVWVSIFGLASTPLCGPTRGACALTGVVRVGSDCDGEDAE